jgi:HrpA-like RNA helicase
MYVRILMLFESLYKTKLLLSLSRERLPCHGNHIAHIFSQHPHLINVFLFLCLLLVSQGPTLFVQQRRDQKSEMGVKSLSTFLRRNADKIGRILEVPPLPKREEKPKEEEEGTTEKAPPQRRNIVVDSTGFLMTLAREATHRSKAQTRARGEEPFLHAALAGGDLQSIRSALAFVIARLRYAFGIELVFAVDAPISIAQNRSNSNRGAVVSKRSAVRDAALAQQLQQCEKDGVSVGSTAALPTAVQPPPVIMPVAQDAMERQQQANRCLMLMEQMYKTLDVLRVTVKHLDDEVDLYVGALCHDYDAICVFTGDSDFVVTPGIPVVMDFDYPWDEMLLGWDATVVYSAMTAETLRCAVIPSSVEKEGPLRLFILESTALASFLNLYEDELLLAASICGNDITEEFVEYVGYRRCIAQAEWMSQAAIAAKELVSFMATGDPTKGLIYKLPVDITKLRLAPALGYLKGLVTRALLNPLDSAARRIDTSSHRWTRVSMIFDDEWLQAWLLTELFSEVETLGRGVSNILIGQTLLRDYSTTSLDAAAVLSSTTVHDDEANAQHKFTVSRGQVSNAAVVNTGDENSPTHSTAAVTNDFTRLREDAVLKFVAACNGVVGALDNLALMGTAFLRLFVLLNTDDDDDDVVSTGSTSGESCATPPAFEDTNYEQDPFTKQLYDTSVVFPGEFFESINQYKLAARRVPCSPLQFAGRDNVRAIHAALVAHRLPLSFMTMMLSGRCIDHAIPLVEGKFGFALDLFTIYRLRQVIAHLLGRTTLRVRNRTSNSYIKPVEEAISADWLTAATATVIEESDAVLLQLTMYRQVRLDLPSAALERISRIRQRAPATTFSDKLAVLAEIFGFANSSQTPLLLGDTAALVPLLPMVLVLWTAHAGCASIKEVRRLAEMMVLMFLSQRGDEGSAITAAARNAVKGLAHVVDQRTPGQSRGHPAARTIDLSRLFAAAFLEVQHVLSLLQMLRIGKRAAFLDPADVFSGTLLHHLSALGTPLSDEILRQAVSHPEQRQVVPPAEDCSLRHITAVIDDVCNHFEKRFTTYQYRKLESYVNASASKVSPAWMETQDEEIDGLESGGCGTKHVCASVPAARATASTTIPSGDEAIDATPFPSALPIKEHIPELVRAVQDNRIVFVIGSTGCGKSSFVPLSIFRDAVAEGRSVYIVCTQPRRVAAIAIAIRVAFLLGEPVGKTVGYRIGGGTRVDSSDTSILFVTTGYLLECLSHQTTLWARVTHLVFDEVHERSLESDMATLVVRLKLQEEDDEGCPSHRAKRLILMSATLNVTLFQDYFGLLAYPTTRQVLEAPAKNALLPVIFAGKRPMPVTVKFLPEIVALLKERPAFPADAIENLLSYGQRIDRAQNQVALQLNPRDVQSMCHLITAFAQPATCILVFLPGLQDIEEFFLGILDVGKRSAVALRLHVLHSIISQEEQHQVFVPAGSNECKIILSTNIAETSVTIEDVKIVVDLGFVRRVVYDATNHSKTLQTEWCSKSAGTQRAGRAGRVSSGTVLRLYTEHVYENIAPTFDSCDWPLEASILNLKLHFSHLGSVDKLFRQVIDPPRRMSVLNALKRLACWGALGPAPDYEVRDLGKLATELPIDIKLTYAIVLAARFGCAADMIVIAAGQMLNYSPYQKARRSSCKSDADFQTWLMETMTSICKFDRGNCNDLFQFLSITEEAVAMRTEPQLRSFCHQNRLNLRQVKSLLNTTRLVCHRLTTSKIAGAFHFTTDDTALMNALRGSNQVVQFPSLISGSKSSEYLQMVLTVCADSMICGVRTTPDMHNLLTGGEDRFLNSQNRKTALSWAQSMFNNVVVFSEIAKPVYDAGEAALLKCLRCFGATSVVFIEKGHSTFGAAVKFPKEGARRCMCSSSLMTTPGVTAICRMNLLHPKRTWSFGSRYIEGLDVLDPMTSNTFHTWRRLDLSRERRRSPLEVNTVDAVGGDELLDYDGTVDADTNLSSQVVRWKWNVAPDRWSSVGSYFTTGSPSATPQALLGVAFTLRGHVAQFNFLFPTHGPLSMLALLATVADTPSALTVTMNAINERDVVAVTAVSSGVDDFDDMLRLMKGPVSPIALLELNLHRVSLYMATDDVFTRTSEEFCLVDRVRNVLRDLRVSDEKELISHRPHTPGTPPPAGAAREWNTTLTMGPMFPSPDQHPRLVIVDVAPLILDPVLAPRPLWRDAVEAYQECMNAVAAGAKATTIPPLPTCVVAARRESAAASSGAQPWRRTAAARRDLVAAGLATPKPSIEVASKQPPSSPSLPDAQRNFVLRERSASVDEPAPNEVADACIQSETNAAGIEAAEIPPLPTCDAAAAAARRESAAASAAAQPWSFIVAGFLLSALLSLFFYS